MKCSLCHNKTTQKTKCLLCLDYFCSYKCMESHITLFHNKKFEQNIVRSDNNSNNININNNIINTQLYQEEKNQTKIKSPYLIPGILNIRRTYDQKYSLNNFCPIFEDGKPKIIGCGSFGQVFLVMNKINKKLYAIKHMEKKILAEKLNNLDGIYKEIYIQSRIDHPNILPILFVNETISDFDLVLEFASYGSLFHFIRNNKSLNEPLTFSLFIQVVNAVFFLHKNNLIHRDIKPENILLFENNILKLCDFGWCVKLEDGQQRDTYCGTTEYMSPELVNHVEYSKEIDVWSLGVLLYEMVHGYSPFRPDKPNFIAKDVIRNIRLHKLRFNNSVSEECKELIYHLLDENPDTRYKVEDIFYSDFVKYYENMKFGLPDNYLVERYKFKLIKAQNQNNIYLNKNNKNNKEYNTSKSDNSRDIHNINLNNNFIDKIKIIYNKNLINKLDIPLSFSDTNLVGKKRTKNKTSQYFHSLSDEEENNESSINIGRVKAKSNSQNNRKKENKNFSHQIPHIGKKIKTIIINNFFHSNNKNNIKTEYKEKINNNNYINIEENDEEQKNYYNDKKDNNKNIKYKKNLHVKQLKINKIPINTKNTHHVHSPTSIINLNSIMNKNYLIFKKNISPKNKMNTEINKSSSLKKTKGKIVETKIIEVKKSKYSRSPKINIINSNNIKKANTRNNLKTHNDIKIKFNSEENLTNTNANTNSNNSYANNLLNSNKDEIIEKKLNLCYTKSLNYLKRKFDNNIKSMFISNIKNKIASNMNNYNYNLINNTLNSDKKKKNNLSYKNEEDLNNIKRIHTSVGCSPKNNIYHNIFILNNIINEKRKKNNNNLKENLSPNISYNFNKNYSFNGNNNNNNNNNYSNKNNLNITANNNNKNKNGKKLFSKKKLLQKNSPESMNNFIEFTKYKINLDKILNNESDPMNKNNKNKNNYYYDKITKPINSIGYNSIFNPIKKSPKEIQNNKSNFINNSNISILKNNSKVKTIKKTESIKKNSNNEYLNRYNSINNIISTKKPNENGKIRINLNNKARNNSGGDQDLSYKLKILKKLEINEFFNNLKLNKYKKRVIPINTDNYYNINCNTSFNKKIKKINTSMNEKNYDEYYSNNNKNKLKLDLEIQNSISSRVIKNNNNNNNNNKNSFCSRNYNKIDNDKEILGNLKSSNSNIPKGYNNNKTLNLDNKKIFMKKEPKIIISPIMQKYKKDINMIKFNDLNKNENLNYINKNMINNVENYKTKTKHKYENSKNEYKINNNRDNLMKNKF